MLFVSLTLSSVFFVAGSYASRKRDVVCYGGSFKFPLLYTPPLYTGPLYFTPRGGGPNKILMDNGKPQERRLHVDFYEVFLRDVRKEDEGDYSTSSFGRISKFKTLKVLDCAEEITRHYLDSFDHRVPSHAYFLEFTPVHNPKQLNILWNRTNHDMGASSHVYVNNNYLSIPSVTQKDDGFYDLRDKQGAFLTRIHLIVQEHTKDITLDVDDHLKITYPWLAPMKTITFTPELNDEQILTMRDGVLVGDYWFNNRIQKVTNGIEVLRVQSQDTGTFHFRDPEDNLIMTVQLKVNDDFIFMTLYYLSIGLLFPAMIILCCCRVCLKKYYRQHLSAPEPPQTSIPPFLYYHGFNKPAGPAAPPSSTLSYRPVNVPKAPTVTFDPPVNQPVNVHVAPNQPEVPVNVPTQPQVHHPVDNVTPSQPEVAPSGGRESTRVPPFSSDVLSSDSEPTFKLKGVTFPSAPPLSSDSTHCDVYTSDKFNFL